MARFVATIEYDVDIEDPNMPQEVLETMIKQGKKTIDLDDDSILANYLKDNISQEDCVSQYANIEELVDGDNEWI